MNAPRPPQSDVPTWRRVVYHLGQLLILAGILLFLSVFLNFFGGMASLFGQATTPGPDVPDLDPAPMFGNIFGSFARAPFGLMLTWIGGALMALGRGGAAGSGLTLDPQGERRDEEPFNRARGGMIEDTLDASPTLKRAITGQGARPAPAEPVVKVRCRNCGALNDETDRYCGQCGQLL